MSFPGSDESVLPGLDRLVRWAKVTYRRWRRERESACVRCGAHATQTCEACGALVCDRCWILSIETGSASALCLDCVATSKTNVRGRTDNTEVFRLGMRALAAIVVAVAAVSYWQHGWSGPRGIVLMLLDPAMLFALVPLAFLLGAIRLGILRIVRTLVSR